MNKSTKLMMVAGLLTMPTGVVFAQQAGWGAKFQDGEAKVKIGGRIQGIMSNDSETESQDFYLRRLRLNMAFQPIENHTFIYDIRNDNSNKGDKGDGKFEIGDAFWKIEFDKPWINNIRVFRSKVDVSYSQTSSSKNLFNPDRTDVSEHASDFVVANRRAANVQANGNLGNLVYHIAIADGVNSNDLTAVNGDTEVDSVDSQKFTYGGKLRYHFIGDAKRDRVQDTMYGQYDQLSLGVGYYVNDKINVTLSDDRELSFRRTLTNVELSWSYKNFRLLSEYFSFTGDIIDLDQTEKDDIFGDSNGYYVTAEYIFGKWGVNAGIEEFDRWADEDDYAQKTATYGINYYDNLEARRYGITYKKTEEEDGLGGGESEKIYANVMLNF